MQIEWSKTETGTVESLDQVPEGATVEAVDGVLCLGRCEGCRNHVLDGTDYWSDEEGVLVC
jgi:hypothetical protein